MSRTIFIPPDRGKTQHIAKPLTPEGLERWLREKAEEMASAIFSEVTNIREVRIAACPAFPKDVIAFIIPSETPSGYTMEFRRIGDPREEENPKRGKRRH